MEEPSVQDVIDLIRRDQEDGLRVSYSMSSVLLLYAELTRLRDRVESLEGTVKDCRTSIDTAMHAVESAPTIKDNKPFSTADAAKCSKALDDIHAALDPVWTALAARDTTTKP